MINKNRGPTHLKESRVFKFRADWSFYILRLRLDLLVWDRPQNVKGAPVRLFGASHMLGQSHIQFQLRKGLTRFNLEEVS